MFLEEDRSLEDILSTIDITMPQMFKIPKILQKVKYKLQLFVDFCLNNEQFTKTMINMGIKVPMHNNENMKQIGHVALQILTCDHDCIVDLFVIDKKRQRIRLYSEDDEEMCQVIVKDEQSGQLMIENQKPKKELSFGQKFANLLQMLNYTSEKIQNIDENCINYLVKVLNTIVRVKPEQVYTFFQEMPSLLNNLIQLTCFPSVCFFFAKMLNQLDSDEYRKYKLDIVYKVIEKLQQQVDNNSFLCRVELVEEVFSKNKFRNDDVDEIKIISQPFVDKNIIDWFVQKIINHEDSLELQNSILYLLIVVRRMNIDEEKDPYNYYEDANKKPTMDFHVSSLFQLFPKLIQLTSKFSKNNSNLSIFNLYELLLAMTKHSTFEKYVNKLTYNEVNVLLNNYNKEPFNGKSGMILYYKVGLIQKILEELKKTNTQPTQEQKQKIKKELEVLNNCVSYAEKKGFDNKLKVLLQINGTDWNQMQVYSTLMAPNSFTQKKTNSVPQFQFLKKIPKVQEHKNGQTNVNEEMKQNKEDKKPSLNLPKLDDRIERMKKKRKQSKPDEQQKQKDQKQQSKKQKLCMNPEVVGFFSRHLIIF